MIFRTHATRPNYMGKCFTQPSLTQPGQTFTVRDLIEKHAAGSELPRSSVAYFDPEDVETINEYFAPHKLDLTDIDRLNEKVDGVKAALETALARRDAAKAEADQKDMFESESDEPKSEPESE